MFNVEAAAASPRFLDSWVFLSGFFEKTVNSFSKRIKLVKKLLPERKSDAISTNELRLEDETIFAEN